MSPLDKLQKLEDGPFHQLCDNLLRHVEPRYRRLRTHGVNPQGVSIKGQPDSYVGETANTCTIAFCYTVQRAGWWNKVVEDVKEAVAASPNVREIVAAIPHNADRDGPQKNKDIDWFGAAQAAAGQATFRVVDGREITAYLDQDYQDLRFEHLGIPYSRLSGHSILASCCRANDEAIVDLVGSGRYDPERYVPRDADRTLFGLWQRAFQPETKAGSSGNGLMRLIPLVNDSGVGKTSLLAAFVRSLCSTLPAILVQAQNLSFASEDSLVAHVVQVLQGVLEPAARLGEETAITHHLAARTRLTVVLDGLDETRNSGSVKRAITYWLRSRLGQASILIVSSRPEFWKLCCEQGWKRWMPASDDRAPTPIAEQLSREHTDTTDGIRLPDRFSEGELEAAWERASRPRNALFALPAETREELRHPFTLRVYLDLSSTGSVLLGRNTRAELLEMWLDRRLDGEVDPVERLTRHQYQQALRAIATRLADSSSTSLQVDDLAGTVPRFDPTHPPGPVVERLVSANILESVPGHPDHIRFTVEAVQDFYRAEADMQRIVAAPAEVAEQFGKLRFTEAYPRLARIGQLLVNQEARHTFVDHLANAEVHNAAVVIRVDPSKYHHQVRERIVGELGREIGSRHRVRGAFALQLLGDLHCQESCDCLVATLQDLSKAGPYFQSTVATTLIKLSVIKGVEFVYYSPLFSQQPPQPTYYFKHTLPLARGANPDFKTALADHAVTQIEFDSGSEQHGRAVCVLAYLGDARLAKHLNERLDRNSTLQGYENHALIALGSDEAGQVFYQSAKRTLTQITRFDYQVGSSEWARLFSQVSSPSGDREYLCTPQFQPYIGKLIDDDDRETFSLGFDLAIRCHCTGLIHQAIVAWTRHYFGGSVDWVRDWMDPESWLKFWRISTELAVQQRLLKVIPVTPNMGIEAVLIECLDNPNLRSDAAWHLGHFGCVRAVASLRQLLDDQTDGVDLNAKAMIALALGLLRDCAAVENLRALALAQPQTETGMFAIMALGLIGTLEAETSLTKLLQTDVDLGQVGAALLCCGTSSAVDKVLTIAQSRQDGPTWICDCLGKAFWQNCRRHLTEHYTHVATGGLVAYLATVQEANQQKEAVLALEAIDSNEIRDLLRRWATQMEALTQSDTQADEKIIVYCGCYTELMRRGDVFAIPYTLDRRMVDKDYIYTYLTADDLGNFPSEVVARELRNRLASAQNNSQAARLLSLLGRFGDHSDEALISRFLDHADDLVANVACESLLRLIDPLLVPENWREL